MWIIWRRLKYRFKRRKIPNRLQYIRYKSRYPVRIIFLGIFILISAWGMIRMCHRVRNVVDELAISKANGTVNNIVNNSIFDLLDKNELSYNELITQSKNDGNGITSMNIDYALVNKFKASLALEIQNRINSVNNVRVIIPAGAFVSEHLFSGFGFKIPINMIAGGRVEVFFEDKFESAGINQTRQLIEVVVKAPVKVISPFRKVETEVVAEVPIAETIIVGAVPDTYLNFGK